MIEKYKLELYAILQENKRKAKYGALIPRPYGLYDEDIEKIERNVNMREFPDNFNPEKETSMRQFETGATRDTDLDKLDYEGFLSPLVIKRYAEYLNKHRKQADGKIRDSDNWQQGIPLKVYMKSLWRHFMDMWSFHRSPGEIKTRCNDFEETICAVIFNASGYLYELLKQQSEPRKPAVETVLETEQD